MKNLIVSLLFAATLATVSAQPSQGQPPTPASEVVKSAQSDAARSGRNVWVLFDASW